MKHKLLLAQKTVRLLWVFFLCIPAALSYAQQSVMSMTLVNANNNNDLYELSNAQIINLASLPGNQLNVRANTSPYSVGSVRFYLNGSLFRTENVAPYALNGDDSGDYYPWNPPLNSPVTLKAIPFSGGNGSGIQGIAFELTVTFVNQIQVNPPAAPSQLVAALNSSGTVSLTWNDNSNNEENFVLETTINGGTSWSLLHTLGVNATSWTYSNPGNQVIRQYRLKAKNSEGESVYTVSNALTIDSPPVAPSGLSAQITSPGVVSLAWNDNAAYEMGFEIQYTDNVSSQNPAWSVLTTLGVNAVSWTDNSFGNTVARKYRVRAFNNKGVSDFANEVVVNTDWGGVLEITGELKKWHKVTLSFKGPVTSEGASDNPFANYRLNVTFTNGAKSYTVPGFYAVDGDAANTSAISGNIWKAHFTPDATGTWSYTASFRKGTDIAISTDPNVGASAGYFDGATGNFNITNTDKTGRDFRGKGRLKYVGEHYLQFSETGEYFIKAGADAVENTFAYEDFDATPNNKGLRKSWVYHQQDYDTNDAGDYTWQNGKGSELLGAIKYLADQGMNVFSFLTFSLDGDDDNIFPHLSKTSNPSNWNDVYHDRFDVSKLAQWEKIMEYGDKKGMYLHFKSQEEENDWLMDGGYLGRERKLYYRELIARFGHHLALNWNLGEENRIWREINNGTQVTKDIIQYIHTLDPYHHNIVIHNWVGEENSLYGPLLGNQSELTGASLQVNINNVHSEVNEWVEKSVQAGKKWIVANDEQGDYRLGIGLDAGYDQINGQTPDGNNSKINEDNRDDVRKKVLWGTLMAGGAGVEYYYGYQTGYGDLYCQDHRTRATKWQDAKMALNFFNTYLQPYLTQMKNDNGLTADGSDYVFAKTGEVYVVFRPNGGAATLNLSGATGTYKVQWYDPRNGGGLQNGSVTSLSAGGSVSIGNPPNNISKDWVALIARDDLAVRITDAVTDENAIVQPNPFSNQLKVELPAAWITGTTHIELISLRGGIHRKVEVHKRSQVYFNTSTLKSGLYLLKITQGKKIKVLRVIKD
ncbi:DUF5060 domain-containing protein [uncultured Microscilla sp.]|uniref:DUF5060 domain-containing protein n=1 Tax=uncultured Microscilla sp. TaxID=432653 RepID=UPI002601A6B6|nr:DUF5060 domain-containing protein [uncultured Microscilla sp.]